MTPPTTDQHLRGRVVVVGERGLLPVIITFKCFLMARTWKDSRCGVGDAARETEDGADNRFQ